MLGIRGEPSILAAAAASGVAVHLDLNVTPVVGQSTGTQRKRAREIPTGNYPDARKLFDDPPTPTPTHEDPAYYNDFMEDIICEGGQAYDVDETQSQDGRGQYTDGQEDMDVHGHEDTDGHGYQGQEDGVDIDDEPLFHEELAHQANSQRRRKSIRTGGYTQDEDKLICEAWMKIGQDPKTGADKKGTTFWKRVWTYFHERRKFEPYKFESNRGDVSIAKRRAFIQLEFNKFCASLENITGRPVSGLGVKDMAFQSLETFKTQHGDKPFTLTHCWTMICECPKFKEQYAAQKKGGGAGGRR